MNAQLNEGVGVLAPHKSRVAVGTPIIALRNAGLIYIVHNAGAFVAKNPPLVRVAWDRFRRTHAQPTYKQEFERSGMDLQVEYESERVEAPAEVAERLGIAEGAPVSETSYKISMADQPVSISLSWEPLAITGGTEIELPTMDRTQARGSFRGSTRSAFTSTLRRRSSRSGCRKHTRSRNSRCRTAYP